MEEEYDYWSRMGQFHTEPECGHQMPFNFNKMFEATQVLLNLSSQKFFTFKFLVRLMHVKVLYHWSNKSFDM